MKKRILGFTLIELLIVITIIGILAVVFIPTVVNAPAKSRDAVRKIDVSNIVKVIEAIRLDGGAVPAAGCVDTVLVNRSSDFPNNILPVDPQSDSPEIGSCTGTGKYTIERYDSGATYGVFTISEAKLGNVACSAIDDTAAPVLTATNGDCYGMILQ